MNEGMRDEESHQAEQGARALAYCTADLAWCI